MAERKPTSPSQVLAALQARAGEKKLVLHLGCGRPAEEKLHARFHNTEWFEVRFDADASVKPHIIGSIDDLGMLPDACIDAIWTSHVIEHLEAHRVMAALQEWFRVLKPGGLLYLTLPDLRAVAAHVAHGRLEEGLYQSPAGPISALDMIYGYGADLAAGKRAMAHRTGFTADTLAHKLIAAGFCNIVVRCEHLNLWAEAYKLPQQSPQRSDHARIVRDAKATTPPPEPPLAAQRHPGSLWQGLRSDEMDAPTVLPVKL